MEKPLKIDKICHIFARQVRLVSSVRRGHAGHIAHFTAHLSRILPRAMRSLVTSLLNQYSPVPRAQLDCWEGCYATARAQIYAGLGSHIISQFEILCQCASLNAQ